MRVGRAGRAILAVGLLGASAASCGDGGAGGSDPVDAASIDHIVVVVEQDHTFDSYFGAYPGADGLEGATAPLRPDRSGRRAPFTPYDEAGAERLRPATGSSPLDNSEATARFAARRRTMDQVLLAQQRAGHQPDAAVMLHTAASAAPLWSVARQGVLFDGYFSAELGGSVANMLAMLTGSGASLDDGAKESLRAVAGWRPATVFERLAERGRTWKYYVGTLERVEPDKVVTGSYLREGEAAPAALYWAPVLAMRRFWTDQSLRAGLVGQAELYRDAAAGTLPDVSFVSPAPSDYPVSSSEFAQTRLLSILNALAKGPDWPSTAVFVVWDDWGGYFDHVPPARDAGFRVPMILLSPWATEGSVSNTPHDHLSILNFIVERFDLRPLSERQQRATGFEDVLRSRPAAERPVFTVEELALSPVGTARQNLFTLVIYAGGAVALAAFVRMARWRWSADRRRGGEEGAAAEASQGRDVTSPVGSS